MSVCLDKETLHPTMVLVDYILLTVYYGTRRVHKISFDRIPAHQL